MIVKVLQMRIRKYFVYGLFLLCFTRVFYVLFNGIVRGEENNTFPRPILFERLNLSYGGQGGLVKLKNRPKRVAEVCKSLEAGVINSRTPSVLKVYHFYEKSRICACHVPKAASTSIGRALLISEYPERADIFRNIPGYHVHTQKEVQNVTSDICFQNSAVSFMVTRNPYKRLYSAYVDKIFLVKFHKLAVVLDVIYNKGITKHELKEMVEKNDKRLNKWYCSVTDVSFEHFLSYVSTSEILDTHLAPVSLLCDPCTNQYDLILKQENLGEDFQQMYEKIYNKNYSEEKDPTITDYTGESGIESQITTYYTHWLIWIKKHNCILTRQLYNAINRRLWNGLKLLGSIDNDLEFIDELFRGPIGDRLAIRHPETIMYEFKANKVPSLSAEERERQRHKALTEAYQGVDEAVIQRIQQLFQLDFILFNYDPTPPS